MLLLTELVEVGLKQSFEMEDMTLLIERERERERLTQTRERRRVFYLYAALGLFLPTTVPIRFRASGDHPPFFLFFFPLFTLLDETNKTNNYFRNILSKFFKKEKKEIYLVRML